MALADASPHRAQHSASIPCQPQETITPPAAARSGASCEAPLRKNR